MALSTPLLIPLLSLILLPSPSTANEGNILTTDELLLTNSQISYNNAALVMQADCNLVLYTKATGFNSGTKGKGTNCILTLSNQGQLLIIDGQGLQVWSSPGRGKQGKYIAVLDPNSVLNVFGPSLWSTYRLPSQYDTIHDESKHVPLMHSVLFSLQILHENSKLRNRDYTLEITKDCNLEFSKASVGVMWHSNTKGMGKHCYARLDKYGRLAVVDNWHRILWWSKAAGVSGNYALVVQTNGQAVVYGPVVWSVGP